MPHSCRNWFWPVGRHTSDPVNFADRHNMMPSGHDASAEMEATIRSVVDALDQVRPQRILAISDHGAQLAAGTGITLTFHHLETQLRTIPAALTVLRSAEHMQNWNRLAGRAIETGVLPSLHHPVTKSFPTVSAGDVGLMAADLIVSGSGDVFRVVHAEGPSRSSAADVARTPGDIAGREIIARELPRRDWVPALVGGGIGTRYAGGVGREKLTGTGPNLDRACAPCVPIWRPVSLRPRLPPSPVPVRRSRPRSCRRRLARPWAWTPRRRRAASTGSRYAGR